LAQSAHAAYEAGSLYRNNYDKADSVVICQVPDETSIKYWLSKIEFNKIPVVAFREPDLGDSITAIATGPLQKQHRNKLSNLPLWRPHDIGKSTTVFPVKQTNH